jgi:hypothetical protein
VDGPQCDVGWDVDIDDYNEDLIKYTLNYKAISQTSQTGERKEEFFVEPGGKSRYNEAHLR